MESWTLSLFLFVLILYYVYLVSQSLQQHQGGTWDASRLWLYLGLPFLLLVYHFVFYGDSTDLKNSGSLGGVLESVLSPLLQWTFWVPLLLAVVLLTYAHFTGSGGKVNVNFNIFDRKALQNLLDGDKQTGIPKRTLLALFNVVLVAAAFLVLLFALTLLVTILRFQRNTMGLLTHTLLYLPCLLSERIAALVGEAGAALPAGLRSQQPIDRTAFVTGVFLVCSMYGFAQLLDTQRTLQDIQAKTASLLSTDPKTTTQADRAVEWYVVAPRKDLRLHQPTQFSLSAMILEQLPQSAAAAAESSENLAVALNQLNHVWSIRLRLFLNSQQQGEFFAKGGDGSLQDRSRNVFSFGENEPVPSRPAGSNFLELRACQEGLFLLSQFFDTAQNVVSGPAAEFKRKIVPFSFQSWHDIVIQHTGGKMDFAIDGQLVESVSTSTSNAQRIPLLSPELTFFFLGDTGFNGVVSNMHIAFNSAITSTNFDHDSLRDRN